MKYQTSEYTLVGFFVALVVVVGLIFIMIPNVEMVTSTIFLSGYLLGVRKGMIIGLIAELIYSLLNPFGAPSPPLLIAQVLSMGIIGYTGGLFYFISSRTPNRVLRAIQFGIAGCLLTLMFDFLTTVSFALFMAETYKKIIAGIISSYAYGSPFYLVHIAVNTLIFAIILPLMLQALTRIDRFRPKLKYLLFCLIFLIPWNSGAAQDVSPDSTANTFHAGSDTVTINVQDSLVVVPSDSVEIDSSVRKEVPQPYVFEFDTSRVQLAWQNLLKFQKRDIATTIYDDLGEVLSYIPGFHYLDRGYPGQLSQITMNGLNPRQVPLRIDGRPMLDPFNDGIDMNYIPVEYIHDIEISPDNSIEMRTERFTEKQPHTRVHFQKGPSEFSETDVGFGQSINSKSDILLGFTLKGFSGPLEPESFEQHTARAKINYRLSPRWRFLYSWLYNRIKLHEVGAKDHSGHHTTPDARSTRLRHDHTLTLKGAVFDSYYQNFITNLYFSSLHSKFKDKTFGRYNDDHYNYAGVNTEFNNLFKFSNAKFCSDVRTIWMNGDNTNNRRMVRYQSGISNRLDFTNSSGMKADIRIDGQSSADTKLGGGIEFAFRVSDKFSTKINATQIIRHPSLMELNGDHVFRGNSDLKSEVINTISAGLNIKPLQPLQLTTELYSRRITDFIDYEQQSDSTVTFINDNRPLFHGLNIKLTCALGKGIHLNSHLEILQYENDEEFLSPASAAGGYFQYTNNFFSNDLKVDLRIGARQWGSRLSHEYLSYRFLPYSKTLSETWITSASAFFQIMDAMNAYIAVENILNEKYQMIYGYPMNDRTIHYGLRWEFRD